MDNQIVCPLNLTNSTELYQYTEDIHIDTVKCSVGVSSFFLVLPLVLFNFKQFPIGATGAVLAGAALTILTQTISQHETYEVLGASENIRTICLLLGMMIMAQYFERELLAESLLSKLLRSESSFAIYLLVVTAFDFLLAAILTNDVACVALTPLILTHWTKRKGPKCKRELSVLLLGIATTANIGSSSTIFGNPQMALIASKTSQPLFDKSRLDTRRCIFYLWLPALLCFGVNYAFLLMYAWVLKWIDSWERKGGRVPKVYAKDEKQKAVQKVGGVNGTLDIVQNANFHHPEVAPVCLNDLDENNAVHNHQVEVVPAAHDKPPVIRSLSMTSSVIASRLGNEDDWKPSNSKIFQGILCLGFILIVVLFLISNDRAHFDMGLVPMGVAIIALCSDALINRRPPMAVLQRVDWSVLLMFFGMFVWLYGLNKTNAPRYIWSQLRVAEIMKPDRTVWSYFVFYAFILICSNIFSNVPLTIIVLELLVPCVNQLELVLYLAWISTIAGNLTLFGSVANLIVSQKAFSTTGHRLEFFEYLRYGFVTTIVTSVIGMAVIFGLLHV